MFLSCAVVLYSVVSRTVVTGGKSNFSKIMQMPLGLLKVPCISACTKHYSIHCTVFAKISPGWLQIGAKFVYGSSVNPANYSNGNSIKIISPTGLIWANAVVSMIWYTSCEKYIAFYLRSFKTERPVPPNPSATYNRWVLLLQIPNACWVWMGWRAD